MKRLLAIFCFTLIAQFEIFAQSTSRFQIWNDFNPSYQINEHWKVGGDIGYRVEPSASLHSVYLRPYINYMLNKIINFSLGIANFNLWEPDLFKSVEFRTYEYIFVSWPKLGGFQFKHRLGLDQRWFHFPESNTDKFVHRSRYRLGIKSPKFKIFNLNALFYITGNVEFLGNINNSGSGQLFDHNRFMLGLGNHITDRFKAEVQFQIIDLYDPNLNDFTREMNVLRIRLFYQFVSTLTKPIEK